MHSAWGTTEIQALIFRHAEKTDLLSLARTCKAFFDVSTEILWETRSSIWTYFEFFPKDVWNKRENFESPSGPVCSRQSFYAAPKY
jgi:F-box-like